MHVPDPPHPLRPEFASRGQMGNQNGKKRATVSLSKPWSNPPRGPVDAPCPTPRGQAGQQRERLRIRGSLVVCFMVAVGDGCTPLVTPVFTRAIWKKSILISIYLFLASPCLAYVFLQFLPEVWDRETWGECPQGICDFLFPWPDWLLGRPGFNTT